jgi:hypothetical protein
MKHPRRCSVQKGADHRPSHGSRCTHWTYSSRLEPAGSVRSVGVRLPPRAPCSCRSARHGTPSSSPFLVGKHGFSVHRRIRSRSSSSRSSDSFVMSAVMLRLRIRSTDGSAQWCDTLAIGARGDGLPTFVVRMHLARRRPAAGRYAQPPRGGGGPGRSAPMVRRSRCGVEPAARRRNGALRARGREGGWPSVSKAANIPLVRILKSASLPRDR